MPFMSFFNQHYYIMQTPAEIGPYNHTSVQHKRNNATELIEHLTPLSGPLLVAQTLLSTELRRKLAIHTNI